MKSSRVLLAFLHLAAAASAASITWDQPNANNNWNTTDANWAGGATFANGDSVTFNSATGETVLVDAAGVAPLSTTVSSAGNWTFAIGSISGTLEKSGTGNLTLSNSNTFTATSLTGGALTLGNISALGSGSLTVASGARSATTEPGLGGSGSSGSFLFLSGITGTQNLVNPIALPSDTTTTFRKIAVQGSGGTVYGANTYNLSGQITGGGTGTNLYFDVATANDGYSVVRLSNSSNSFTGRVEFNRGSLQIDSDTVLGPSANALKMDAFNISRLIFNYAGSFTHPTEIATATTFDTGANNITATAVISGGARLTKIGSGALTLNAANTYTNTTITNGPNSATTAAIVVGNNTALGSGSVTLNNTATITALFNGSASRTISNNIALSTTAGVTTNLLAGNATAFELSGVVSGGTATSTLFINTNLGGGSTGFVKLGNVANTFSGRIQINRGGLAINSDAALGNAANPVVIDIGTATQIGLRFDSAISSARSIQLGAGKQVVDTNGNNVTLSGVISNVGPAGDLFKSGAGTLTLSGTNTYTGTTTVNAGTLQIGAGGTTGTIGSGAVTNNGSISFNRSNSLSLSNAISGTGGISQDGAGTTTLSGSSSYTGVTAVSAGALNVTGSLSAASPLSLVGGELRFGPSSDPIGTLTTPSLTQTGGTLSLDVSGSQSDLVTVNGNYTRTSGGIVVNLISAPLEGVPYTLVNYTGTLSENPPVTFTGLSGSRLTGNVNYGTGSNSAITVSFVGVPANLVWSGSTNNTWDVNTTQNWKNGPAADTFFQQDHVTFDDSPASGNFSPVLDFNALCSSVTFNNSSNTYLLSGTGAISGGTQIQMTGSGTTILATNNTNTGQVTVSSGTLKIGNGGTVGSLGSGEVIVDSALVFDRSDTLNFPNAVFGSGTVTKLGAGNLVVTGSLGQTGDLTISAGSISLGNGGTTGNVPSANIVNHGNLTINRSSNLTLANAISGSGSLSKLGSSILTLQNSNSFGGGTQIQSGTILVTNPSALGAGAVSHAGGQLRFSFGDGTTTTLGNDISLNSTGHSTFAIRGTSDAAPSVPTTVRLTGKISGGATGQVYLLADSAIIGNHNNILELRNASNDFQGTIQLERGTLGIDSDGALGHPDNDIIHFTENLNGALRFDADNIVLSPGRNISMPGNVNSRPINTQAFTATIPGNISGTGILVKQGTGKLILSGTNSATAATSVAAGTLQVDGTFNTAAAAVTVNSGATLSGVGTINRPVTVTGTVAPGVGVGNLTIGAATAINGTLAVDVNGAASDKLSVTGNLTLGAGSVLSLNLLPGGFTQPSYVIAECTATLSGTFATVPSGYSVTYTANQAILTPASGFTSWATAMGLDGTAGKENGPSDDPDQDGIKNLLEYMLDGNPLANSAAVLPQVSEDATSLTLTFDRRDDSETDTTQFIEFGSTLASWTSVAIPSASGTTIVNVGGKSVSFTVTENGTDPDHLVVEIPVGTDTSLFARVRISD